ncbi:MAG: hypothetical protein EHM88_20165 [Candidatus Rokuibacteriota bacterium]|jgi:hypothetical protein|nr:MAG: hypothetical protein EHM88_20165 [Candidatus Rokubacteria bacterium]
MRHVTAAAALVLALAGCRAADPLPEGSGDFPTGSPTTATAQSSPATVGPDRAACREALKPLVEGAVLGGGDLEPADLVPELGGTAPPECAGIEGEALLGIVSEALAEVEQELRGGDGPAAGASTCDVAREAFLTGTEAEIEAALAALVADTTADAAAREAAQSYLEEDDPTLRGLHKNLVQYTCSIP